MIIESLKEFAKTMILSSHSKMISVYNNSTQHANFFSYLSTDNYFVLDLQNCKSSWALLNHVIDMEYFPKHETNYVHMSNILRQKRKITLCIRSSTYCCQMMKVLRKLKCRSKNGLFFHRVKLL